MALLGAPYHPLDARPQDALPCPPALPPTRPPTPIVPSVPQLLADSGEFGDNFTSELALINAQSYIPVGGTLQFFWRHWKVIRASKRVVRWCRKGYSLPFAPSGEEEASWLLRRECPPDLIPRYRPQTPKVVALAAMMDTLLEKHVIEPIPAGQACFYNIVFLRPKPNGSWTYS